MNILRLVGLNLRAARLRKGLSQEALANEAGVAMNYVSGIERGAQNPTVMVLHRLAMVLGIQEAKLFGPISGSDRLPKNLAPGRKSKSARGR
ncbi:MAG TPA: helix-turn-helix transcriptional regulator [Rhizomicrobium sp.]|nr:helix-turn-helix transcriptional regulator [Rhizomicrobium sp.]